MKIAHEHERDFVPLRALRLISGFSVRTLRRRIKDSSDPLPAYRLGRRGKLLVKLSEFRRWMKTLKVQPATASRMPRRKRQATANGIAVSTERTQKPKGAI